MPLITLPSGEVITAIVRFGFNPHFCHVSYGHHTFQLDYDPHLDNFFPRGNDDIPHTVVEQINAFIKSDKVEMSDFAHFFVPFEDEEYRYYASCNFHFYADMEGISPSGAVQVCLLDPKRGSIYTMLELDEENDMYVVSEDYEPLDSLQIDTISQAIKQHRARFR